MKHYAVLEAGGTKMVMGMLDKDLNILERISIPTRAPEETMKDMLASFRPRSPAALDTPILGVPRAHASRRSPNAHRGRNG